MIVFVDAHRVPLRLAVVQTTWRVAYQTRATFARFERAALGHFKSSSPKLALPIVIEMVLATDANQNHIRLDRYIPRSRQTPLTT